MTQSNTDELKVPPYSSVEDTSIEQKEQQHISPKLSCPTHGPSQAPLLDHELQKPRSKEILQNIAAALNDLASEKQCTRCTVEKISTLVTGHVREMREAKRNGEWTKEERKVLKSEAKAIFKPVKKDIKALWRAN